MRGLSALVSASLLVALIGHADARAPAAARRGPLFVANVRSLSLDEQLVFTALQGIVNRAAPKIYLVGLAGGQNFATDPTAERWLKDAVDLPVRRLKDPYALLVRFRGAVRGLAVWDPNLAIDTQNVATTMAGLEDLLPVSPALARRLARPPFRLRVVHDLRKERFVGRAAAYEWALTHVGPLRRIGLLAWLGGPRNGLMGQHGLRDFIVAHRGFAFEAEPMAEARLVMRILDAFPPGMSVFGYPFVDDPVYRTTRYAPGEPAGVSEISYSGKQLIPSADATNLTVHSWYRSRGKHPAWDDRPTAPDASKTYVTFVVTDGDNIGWDQQNLRMRYWDNSARGSIPIGLSISPLLAVYAPRIYEYFLRTSTTNDVFIAGPSGAGYTYPAFQSDLDGYLARTRSAMRISGLRAVWILDWGYLASPAPQVVQRYVRALKPAAIFTDYGGWVLPNPPAVSFCEDVPVVHAAYGENVTNTVWRIRGESERARLAGQRPGFVFVALITSSMGYTEARSVAAALPPSFVVVRPDRFVGLLRGARSGGSAGWKAGPPGCASLSR